MQQRPLLAYGLLAGGGGVALLLVLWLLVSGAHGGGIVLGLLLLFVLAGPLLGAGGYMLSRQRTDALAASTFAGKRRILEADRLFRRELAGQLRQLAAFPALSGQPVAALADDLELEAYDAPEWYDTVQLTDADAQVLRRYDDLVWERVRWLREHAQDGGTTVDGALRQLDTALDQRRSLLLRGQRAPEVSPGALMRATGSHDPAAFVNMALSDAVSYDGSDYLVQAIASYFAEGQTWKVARLDGTSPGAVTRWLYVAPGGLTLALMDELPGLQPGASALQIQQTAVPVVSTGTATVDVAAVRGAAQGVLVSYWSYARGALMGQVEQWPDGSLHGYGGTTVRPDELELWPARVPLAPIHP